MCAPQQAGAEDIKKHKWLTTIDYNALYARSLTAPIVPKCGPSSTSCPPHAGVLIVCVCVPVCSCRVGGATDTSNFDPYPDSPREAADPVFSGRDPFLEF